MSSATGAARRTGRSGGTTSGGTGEQSPIVVPGAGGAASPITGHRHGRLRRDYRPSPATLVNRGHDSMVRFDGDAGGLLIDGVANRLQQMHWHSPSEHALDGRRYDLELHMLHQSDRMSNKYAVVAQLFKIGRRLRLFGARKNARPLQEANGGGVGLYNVWPRRGRGKKGSVA